VAPAIFPASASGPSRVALGPSTMPVFLPDRRISATASMVSSAGFRVGGTMARTGAADSRETELQAASAGRISEAIRPGAVRAAATAAAASPATVSAVGEVRTQWLNGRAVPSMSEVRGAS